MSKEKKYNIFSTGGIRGTFTSNLFGTIQVSNNHAHNQLIHLKLNYLYIVSIDYRPNDPNYSCESTLKHTVYFGALF